MSAHAPKAAVDELRLLCTLARADGTIDRAERSFVVTHALATGVSLGTARALLAEPSSGQVALPPPAEREACFERLVSLATEDGAVSDAERAFLTRLGRAMKLDDVEGRLARALAAGTPAASTPARTPVAAAGSSSHVALFWFGLTVVVLGVMCATAARLGAGTGFLALVAAVPVAALALAFLAGFHRRAVTEEVEATVRVVQPTTWWFSTREPTELERFQRARGLIPTPRRERLYDEVFFTWRDSTGARGRDRKVVKRGSMRVGERFRTVVVRGRADDDV